MIQEYGFPPIARIGSVRYSDTTIYCGECGFKSADSVGLIASENCGAGLPAAPPAGAIATFTSQVESPQAHNDLRPIRIRAYISGGVFVLVMLLFVWMDQATRGDPVALNGVGPLALLLTPVHLGSLGLLVVSLGALMIRADERGRLASVLAVFGVVALIVAVGLSMEW